MPDFDTFADAYDQTFTLAPFRTHIEAYSLFKTIGEVPGQEWLDVACGTGTYSRALRQRGARRVVGVDISEEMLRLARASEQDRPLGVEYRHHDAGAMPELGDFDGALGVYLLHYATSAEHLYGMCRSIAGNLRPGGRFVTYQLNPDFSREPDYYLPYGAEMDLDPDTPLADGHAIVWRLKLPGMSTPDITSYYWSRATLEDALRAAGLDEIRWTAPELSPDAPDNPHPAYYRNYIDHPFCLIIDCVRR